MCNFEILNCCGFCVLVNSGTCTSFSVNFNNKFWFFNRSCDFESDFCTLEIESLVKVEDSF